MRSCGISCRAASNAGGLFIRPEARVSVSPWLLGEEIVDGIDPCSTWSVHWLVMKPSAVGMHMTNTSASLAP